MERAIEVGGSFREWWFLALAGLAAVLLSAAALLLATGSEGGVPALVAGALVGLATALAAVEIVRRRFSIQMTPDGFIVQCRDGEREYTDEAVICASLYSTPNYSNGDLNSHTRVFDVWVEDERGPQRYKMVSRISIGAVDPLEWLIERIVGHLCDRAEAALASNLPFEGEGWSLHGNELVVLGKRSSISVRTSEIAAVEVFDQELRVWKHGQDEQAARIPIRSANAIVLHRLLEERVQLAPEQESSQQGTSLGRVLFERKPGRPVTIAAWLLPIAVVGLLVGFGVAALIRWTPELALIGAVAAFVAGMLWLIPLSQCVQLRCHERGVVRRWLRWEQRLAFQDVESFEYSAAKQYVKGIYSGTTFTLTFVPISVGKSKKLSYSRTLRNADEELDHLRDHVSRVIAARMAKFFSGGAAVSWTPALRFLADELEYRATGFLGAKPPILIPYEKITGTDITEGQFSLWIGDRKKPVVKEPVARPNFFPGYLFLTQLLSARLKARALETVRGA